MSQYYALWLRNYEIYQCKQKKYSIKQLQQKFGLSYSTIQHAYKWTKNILDTYTTRLDEIKPSEVLMMFDQGLDIRTICDKYRATPEVINIILTRNGRTIPESHAMPTRSKDPAATADKKEERRKVVEAMYDKGMTKREIADAAGVSVRTVESSLHDSGVIPVDNVVKLKGKRQKLSQNVAFNKVDYCHTGILDFVRRKDFLNFNLFPMQELILKIFYGLDLTDHEKKIAEQLYDHDKNGAPNSEGKSTWDGTQKEYKELVLVTGMRGGKTVLASVIACIEEHELYKHYITRGSVSDYYGFAGNQQVFILIVATNETQALDTSMSAIRSRVRGSDYYKNRGGAIKELETDFKFYDTNLVIRSGHSNSSSLAGKTSKAVIIEELSRFRDSRSGSRSSRPVYETVTRGTASFGNDGKIINITSPLEATDFCFELYDAARDVDNMVGFILPTWKMNPNIFRYASQCTKRNHAHLQAEYRKNPEGAARDYGCDCSMALEAYFRRQDKIDNALSSEKQPIDEMGRFAPWFRGKSEYTYFLHGDPAVKNDNFGLCLGHAEEDKVVIDLLHYFKAPKGGEIDMEELQEFFNNLMDLFQIDTASFDTWAIPSIKQSIEKRGVQFKNLLITKEVYDNLKGMIYNDQLVAPKNGDLEKELKELVLINGKKVDHLKKGSKDLADSLAGVCFHCFNYMEQDSAYKVKYGHKRIFGNEQTIAEKEGLRDGTGSISGRLRRIEDTFGI